MSSKLCVWYTAKQKIGLRYLPSIICPQWGLWWGRGGHTELGVTPVTHYGLQTKVSNHLQPTRPQKCPAVRSLCVVDCGYYLDLCNPTFFGMLALSWEAKITPNLQVRKWIKLFSLGSPELALLSQPPLSHPKCTKEGYNAVGMHKFPNIHQI